MCFPKRVSPHTSETPPVDLKHATKQHPVKNHVVKTYLSKTLKISSRLTAKRNTKPSCRETIRRLEHRWLKGAARLSNREASALENQKNNNKGTE
ncbi:hypothetical protein Zmor_006404 [Zophobas morio]|uniref:Uncharacterized protein n=1 Tax=Zophobas morio TaxID=2755281 RepID=A0AA38IXB0_9CUCU|nr:hypothetical protein Zmor_006404 [Zophobas morio]